MSLTITQIKLDNFRSYENFDLQLEGNLCVLVGPNAVGKTNVVEGVQLLTALSSFRHATAQQLVRQGCSSCRASIHATGDDREVDIVFTIDQGKRAYHLNGKARKSATLRGIIPSVTFTPDDLEIAKGANSVRRDAFDLLGSQLSKNYHVICHDYAEVIKYKNKLLKEEADNVFLDSIDEMLLKVGSQLMCYRWGLMARFLPYLERNYSKITFDREFLTSTYCTSWDEVVSRETSQLNREYVREKLEKELQSRRVEERARGRAVVGPHSDKIDLFIQGKDARVFASQGQQRSAVLAWKLAEVELIQEMTDNKPVLLLDDVMSELDSSRREQLTSFVNGGLQTIITTTNLSYFTDEVLNRAQIVQLPIVQLPLQIDSSLDATAVSAAKIEQAVAVSQEKEEVHNG